MQFRIAVIAVLTGLLVTGCSSERSVTVENQVKLIEYEKCLLLQQEGLNIINKELAQSESFTELLRILDRQDTSRFEIHLKNCEKYRPLTLP
jgi:uncharacterized protein YcfL